MDNWTDIILTCKNFTSQLINNNNNNNSSNNNNNLMIRLKLEDDNNINRMGKRPSIVGVLLRLN